MKGEELKLYLQKTIQDLQNNTFDKAALEKLASQVLDTIKYNCGPEEYDLIGKVYDEFINKGLDLNVDSSENVANFCIWIEHTPTALMLMKKFLDNGANPNFALSSEGESLYEYVDFAVGFDMFGDDKFMRLWLLLIAYGGRDENGATELKMKGNYDYSIFKDVENYDFCIELKLDKYHMMYFFDKKSKEIVASYEKHWNIS